MPKPNNAFVGVKLWLNFFGLLPLALVVASSFLSIDATHNMGLPLTLQHYTALLTPAIAQVLSRSLVLACVTTGICLLLAYPFSFFLTQSKHQSLLLMLIIIPFWTSSLIRTYALIALLKTHGILNLLLLKLGVIQHPLALMYTNTTVIIGLIYSLFPFMVLPLLSQMQRFDFRLLEAARDLGANHWTVFYRIFLPHTLPGILSGSMLTFLPAMTLFYIPNILGGARSILLGNLIQNQFFIEENWPLGCATSVLLTAVLLLMLTIANKSRELTA